MQGLLLSGPQYRTRGYNDITDQQMNGNYQFSSPNFMSSKVSFSLQKPSKLPQEIFVTNKQFEMTISQNIVVSVQ